MADFLFGLTWLTPLIFTILVASLTSTISQFTFAIFTNKEFMTTSRKELKRMQKELLGLKPEDKGFISLQKKMMDLNMQLMNHSLKPSLFTTIPFLIIFSYAKSVVPMDIPLINLPFSLPIIGNSLEFFGVYFIVSLTLSMVLRKVLKR